MRCLIGMFSVAYIYWYKLFSHLAFVLGLPGKCSKLSEQAIILLETKQSFDKNEIASLDKDCNNGHQFK